MRPALSSRGLGSGQRDPFGTYGRSRTGVRMPVKVFDPRAKWLIEHQDARPYGDEMVISAEPRPRPGAEAAAGGRRGAGLAGRGAGRRPADAPPS